MTNPYDKRFYIPRDGKMGRPRKMDRDPEDELRKLAMLAWAAEVDQFRQLLRYDRPTIDDEKFVRKSFDLANAKAAQIRLLKETARVSSGVMKEVGKNKEEDKANSNSMIFEAMKLLEKDSNPNANHHRSNRKQNREADAQKTEELREEGLHPKQVKRLKQEDIQAAKKKEMEKRLERLRKKQEAQALGTELDEEEDGTDS